MHIADSVLCDGSSNSTRQDNSWLGVPADVGCGRSIARHDWRAPAGSQEKIAVVHIASKDVKRNGPVVKQWLDASFSMTMRVVVS